MCIYVCVCIYKTKSFCCIAEINTIVNQLYFNKNFKMNNIVSWPDRSLSLDTGESLKASTREVIWSYFNFRKHQPMKER